MIPLWLAVLAVVAVIVENAIRMTRRGRKDALVGAAFASDRDHEFQRVHELLELVRESEDVDSREQAIRQMHAELSKLHRTVIGAGVAS